MEERWRTGIYLNHGKQIGPKEWDGNILKTTYIVFHIPSSRRFTSIIRHAAVQESPVRYSREEMLKLVFFAAQNSWDS